MFERFTDAARRAVVLAQEEARRLDHDHIGTEHVLLGLLHEESGVAARALDAVGLSLDGMRAEVERIVGRGTSSPTGHIPFTGRAKKVLELSLREALQLGHNYIGTEHILLGVIREGGGVAAQALVAAGVQLDRLRAEVAGSGTMQPAQGRGRRWFRRPGPVPDEPEQLAQWDEPSPLELLDDVAWAAVGVARRSARDRRSPRIAMRDLLVGVAAVAGPAVTALRAAGLDPSTLDLRTRVGDDAQDTPGGRQDDQPAALPLTDTAREALRWASEESTRRGHAATTTAHLLLALLVTADADVGELLDRTGVDRRDLHAETARVLAAA